MRGSIAKRVLLSHCLLHGASLHHNLTIYVYIHVCLACGSNVTYIGLERGPMAPEVSMATVVKR